MQRLPEFLSKGLSEGRADQYASFIGKLERCVVENNFDGMNDLPFDFEVFHRIHRFSKEEKKHIFLLLANFLG